MGVLSSVVGGLFGLANTGAQAAANAASERRNFEYSKQLNAQQFGYQQDLQKQQNDFNVDMWNKENEYNSAVSQVQRLKDAGLNVGMMMSGQGAGQAQQLTSANPGVPTSNNANFAQAPDMSVAGSMLMQGMNMDLQRKQLEIANKKADAEIENLDAQSEYQRMYNKNYKEFGRDEMINNIDQVSYNIQMMRKTMDSMNYDNKLKVEQIFTERFNRNLSWNQYLLQAGQLHGQLERWQHENKLSDANAAQLYGLLGYYQALTTGIHIDNGLKATQFKYADQWWNAEVVGKNNQASLFFWQGKESKNHAFQLYWDSQSAKLQFKFNRDTFGFNKVNHYFTGVTNMISSAANSVSDVAGAAMDVYTFGATANLKKGAASLQGAQTNFYNGGGFQTTSHMNPNVFHAIGQGSQWQSYGNMGR